MFGSPFGGGFLNDDPFFSDMHNIHRQHMQAMESMFARDPFMFPAVEGPRAGGRSTAVRQRDRGPLALSPFGMMDSMFGNLNSMMGNMHRNMESLANNPNAHCYSSSTVMSYSNTGDGAPKVYQASSSTRQAPGGVRETRRTVRDSERGIEKMAIGHHIGDRGHVIEKSRNSRTGDMEEKQDFLNIDEDEAHVFDTEWKQRTGSRHGGRSVTGGRTAPPMAAITDGREHQRDREQRPTRHHDSYDRYDRSDRADRSDHSVRFDRSERTSDDAHPYQRRPTPARPKGPSKGGRYRDGDQL